MGLIVRRNFFLIVVLLCFCFFGEAQRQTPEVGLPANQKHVTVLYHQGLVIPHHANMVYYLDDFSRGVELTYGIWRFDQEGWQRNYNYPEVGIGLFYNSYGNPDIYGKGMALYPYLHFPIIQSAFFTLKNKVAFGVGYTNKPFHYEDNPKNHVFGARLNAYVGLGLYAGFRIQNHWSVYASGGFNHMSNGAIRKPNNGINTITVGLGTRYHFSPDRLPKMSKGRIPRQNGRDIQVFINYGRSQANDFDFNIYQSGSVSINHLWYHSVKSAWSVGADFIYFGAAPYAYDHPDLDEYVPHWNRTFAGLFAGHHWIMGNTSLFLQLGTYVYSYLKPPQPVYPRLGIRQDITRNLMVNFSVKASFFRSEFMEFGIGYRIPYKENDL
jgi:hypothetical protein